MLRLASAARGVAAAPCLLPGVATLALLQYTSARGYSAQPWQRGGSSSGSSARAGAVAPPVIIRREASVRKGDRVSVILREQLDNLGYKGEEVSVSPGYARNYLVPFAKAWYATELNRQQHKVVLPPEEARVIAVEREVNMLRARVASFKLQFSRATNDGVLRFRYQSVISIGGCAPGSLLYLAVPAVRTLCGGGDQPVFWWWSKLLAHTHWAHNDHSLIPINSIVVTSPAGRCRRHAVRQRERPRRRGGAAHQRAGQAGRHGEGRAVRWGRARVEDRRGAPRGDRIYSSWFS